MTVELNIKHEPPDQPSKMTNKTTINDHKQESELNLVNETITTDNNHRMKQLMRMKKPELINLCNQYKLKIIGTKTKAQLAISIIETERTKTKNKQITNFFKRKRQDTDDNNTEDTPDSKRQML